MSIQTIAVQLDVPKESKELVDLAKAVIVHVKEKRPLSELGLLVPAGLMAAEGSDKVDDEFKSAQRSALAGYLVKELLDVLVPYKEPVAEPAAPVVEG